jgi:hypothetical protein
VGSFEDFCKQIDFKVVHNETLYVELEIMDSWMAHARRRVVKRTADAAIISIGYSLKFVVLPPVRYP